LEGIAAEVQAVEGWKWASVHIDFPHAHGMRRSYPHAVDLSEEDAAAYGAAQEEYDRLSSEYEGYEELPDEADRRLGELEAEIERIDAKRHAYDADEIERGGVFVILNHDGTARIERGFIRAEDEAPEPEGTEDATVTEEGEIVGEGDAEDAEPQPDDEEAEDAEKPLSDGLIRDLTAHRTLGLRLALGEQPDRALVAVVHALAAQTFYRGCEASCLEIRLTSAYLASHADGIEDTPAAKALADRHAGWASDMPRDVADLWGFVAGLDHASVMALLAHCAALTVNAVRLPWEQKPNARATVEKLASAVTLDMTAHWTPTVRTYLGRVTQAHILAAVREAVGDEAAERIAGLKKTEMAQAAEQLLAGTGWLPSVLRIARPALRDTEADIEAFVQAAE
jgi:ParB family chromosome partitioning protein